MSTSATPAKPCIWCNQDCAGKPRIKDERGRYACKSCHEAQLAKAAAKPKAPVAVAAAAPKPAALAPDFGDDDLASIQSVSSGAPGGPQVSSCPSCHTPMVPLAVLCTFCGYNKHTGKKPKAVKVKAEREPGGESAVLASLWFENPIVWFLAAVVGAGVGAAVWIMVMLEAEIELSIIGIGLGACTGLAVVLVARHKASFGTGLMAGAVALAAVIGARYFGMKMMMRQEVDKVIAQVHISTEEAKVMNEVDTARKWEQQGKKLAWPGDEEAELDFVTDSAELPADVVKAADTQWAAADDAWRESYRVSQEEQIKSNIRTLAEDEIDAIASKEMTALHMPERGVGGFRSAKGAVLMALWPYAMPCLAAWIAYSFASGAWVSFRD